MIASLTADAQQISDMVCQLARPTQRTVACSHLIEYAPKGARYARSDASSECGLGVAGNGAFRAYSHGSSIVAACGGIGGPCANAPWVCPMKKLEPARSEPADLRRINTGGLPAYRAV